MNVTASAISLNVADEQTSAKFARDHLGFTEDMSTDGFVSLSRPDTGFNVVFLTAGLDSFQPQHMRGHVADGLLIALVVEDVDAEYARLQREGVAVTTPIQTEPWGQRFFQVSDPNGVIFELTQWVES